MNKEEFIKQYCRSCGSQRCEGVDSEWFDGCKWRDKMSCDDTVKTFLNELNALQDKYGIYIDADYKEIVDYDWDERPYVSGIDARVVFVNSGGYTIEDIYKDVDNHYHLLYMVCD